MVLVPKDSKKSSRVPFRLKNAGLDALGDYFRPEISATTTYKLKLLNNS